MDPHIQKLSEIAKAVKEKTTSIRDKNFTALPPDFEPTEFSVICARGKGAYDSPGNTWFRSLVAQHTREYSDASTKMEKSLVVSSIVDAVRKASPQGSFIRKVKGQWQEVTEGVARERVGQSLRDMIDTSYRSSNSARSRIRTKKRDGRSGVGAPKAGSSDSEEDDSHPQTEPAPSSSDLKLQVAQTHQELLGNRAEKSASPSPARYVSSVNLEKPVALNYPADSDMTMQASQAFQSGHDAFASAPDFGATNAFSSSQQDAFGRFTSAQEEQHVPNSNFMTNAVDLFEKHPLISQRNGNDADPPSRSSHDEGAWMVNLQVEMDASGRFWIGHPHSDETAGGNVNDESHNNPPSMFAFNPTDGNGAGDEGNDDSNNEMEPLPHDSTDTNDPSLDFTRWFSQR